MPFQNAFAWGHWLDSELERSRNEHAAYVCSLMATCQGLNTASSPTLVTVVNVSPAGLGLLASRRFAKGEILHLDLPLSRGPLLVCVGHTAIRPDNRWFVACTFVSGWTTDTVEAFRNALVPEKRACERFPCEIPASYRELTSQSSWNEATIFDISTGGICLVAARPIREGTTLWLNAPGIKAPVYVLRMEDLGNGRWKYGCSFLRELSQASLLSVLPGRRARFLS